MFQFLQSRIEELFNLFFPRVDEAGKTDNFDVSFAEKSIALLLIGVVLLLFYWIMP
jgi:hypothetical protein